MPLGSSSLAPVISPGPRSCTKPANPLRFAAASVVRTPSPAGCGPGLTTERIGSSIGSGGDAGLIEADSSIIISEPTGRPRGILNGHNQAGGRTVVTTVRRVWSADNVTDRMRQEGHRE